MGRFIKAKLFLSFVFWGWGGPCLAGALKSFLGSTPLSSHPWGHSGRWPPMPPICEVGSGPLNDEPCLIVGRKRTEAGKEWKNFLLADKQLLLVATNGKSIFTLLCPSKGADLHDTKKPSAKNWKRAFLFGNYKLKIGNHTIVFQVRRRCHRARSIQLLSPQWKHHQWSKIFNMDDHAVEIHHLIFPFVVM